MSCDGLPSLVSQNNLLELFTLLRFTMPTVFKPSDVGLFESITSGSLQLTGTADRVMHFRQMLDPFILRRLKTDVLGDLPPKREVVLRIPMTAHQQALYSNTVAKGLTSGSSGAATLPAKPGKLPPKTVKHLFTELRKAANHPLLLREHYGTGDEVSPSRVREICSRRLEPSSGVQKRSTCACCERMMVDSITLSCSKSLILPPPVFSNRRLWPCASLC